MPLIHHATREITAKIVYYGPARGGKTTNLQCIHRGIPEESRGPIVSLSTEGDRTLFFDFLPLDLGSISGYSAKVQLYTVPGQVYYETTRRLVLQGADGIVFVADSAPEAQADNRLHFRGLQDNLLHQGVDPRSLPICLQYNKRDLPNAVPIARLESDLNFRRLPMHPATALTGEGVFETLQTIVAGVFERLDQRYAREGSRREQRRV